MDGGKPAQKIAIAHLFNFKDWGCTDPDFEIFAPKIATVLKVNEGILKEREKVAIVPW